MDNENGAKSAFISNTENESSTKYTIPGILHFIQHEWARFEMERAHWEVERAELQARIAFLQGERKGQENLKHDLIRRIKMLEYALQQERNKFFRLKYGKESPQSDAKSCKDESLSSSDPLNDLAGNNRKAPVNWRQGRQLLRQYLQEVGYTDTVLDVRSSRVRSILGLSVDNQLVQENIDPNSKSPSPRPSPPLHTEKMTNGRPITVDKSSSSGKGGPPVIGVKRLATSDPGSQPGKRLPDETDPEASVLATFDFLANEVEDEDNDSDNEADDGCSADDESDERHEGKIPKKDEDDDDEADISHDAVEEMLTGDEEAADALEEFDFLVSENSDNGDADDIEPSEPSSLSTADDINITMPEDRMPDAPGDNDDWKVNEDLLAKLKEQYKKERKGKKNQKRPARSALQAMLANLGGEEEIPPPISTGNPPLPGGPSAGRGVPPRMMTDAPPVDIPAPAPGFGPVNRRTHVVDGRTTADEAIEAALGLGDLAGLTVANEADPLGCDASAKEEFRKTWNPKFTLRSHFDGIRSLCFHPMDHVFFTGSEDHTLKLWNLQKTVPQKKSNALDVEPVFTFRKHSGPVLCTGISPSGETLYSGSTDSTIQCWKVPNINLDPYGPYDPTIVGNTLVAHTDAVWDLAVQSGAGFILSCSADGTCRLWNPNISSPLLNTFHPGQDFGAPTSIDFIRSEVPHMVASYAASRCVVYDLETAKTVVKLESNKTYNNSLSTQINKVISHPTLPLTITAHEDRYIRFFDNTSGKQIHSMVAHLDAVTSLAIDPNGLYLLSGSHDCSIRLWNLDTKTCVQEITSHRKKFDESIYDVAFHPTKPYIASAGADGLAKIFV